MIDAGANEGWDQVVSKLRRFVARRAPAADAEDVLQEALLAIQRGLPKLRDNERVGPWIYSVTRNAVIDQLRARGRADKKHGDFALEPTTAGDPPDEVTTALAACVTVFVAQLPSPYREAITLTELQGRSQKEAAEMVGVSLSGMKSRVQRGRDKLREMFEQCCQLTLDTRRHVMACEPRSSCDPNECKPSETAHK